MFGLLRRNTSGGCALLLFIPFLALACGNFDSPFMDGADDSGSLLRIEKIDPTYFDEATNQVDVIRDACDEGEGESKPEPYTDHYAVVAFTNRSLPNAPQMTASMIYLTEYDIRYTPASQGTPALPSLLSLPITATVGIQPCQPGQTSCPETEFTVELVPVRQKAVLAASLGSFQLQYNVRYKFYGFNDFGEWMSSEGSTFIYVSNYDFCEGG